MRPNTFIVGAPRSGTTALYTYLSEHPQVFAPGAKEPHFFSTDFPRFRWATTLEDYLSVYRPALENAKVALDGSVMYLYSQRAAGHIRDFDPQSRIIVALRNHVDYLHSYHAKLVYNRDESIEDLYRAWLAVPERKSGLGIPATCREPSFLFYDDVGMIGAQLQRLFSVFPRCQVHCVLFDDLKRSPRTEYQRVLRFLDLEDDGRRHFPVVNPRHSHRSKVVGRITQSPPRSIMEIWTRARTLIGLPRMRILNQIRRANTKRSDPSPVSRDVRALLVREFSPDRRILESTLDRDLSSWSRV